MTTPTTPALPSDDVREAAAWQILEWWADGNDATILKTRKRVVELLKEQAALAVQEAVAADRRRIADDLCELFREDKWNVALPLPLYEYVDKLREDSNE